MSSVYRLHFDETEIKIQQMEAMLKSTDRDTQLYGVICDYLGVLRSLKAAYAKLEDAPDMAMMNELQRDAVKGIADMVNPHTAVVVVVHDKGDNSHERYTMVRGDGAHIGKCLVEMGVECDGLGVVIGFAAEQIKKATS